MNKLLENVYGRINIIHGDFTLSSGRRSSLFIDLMPALLNAKCAFYICDAILYKICFYETDYIGGMETGAIPISTVAASINYRTVNKACEINAFFIKKDDKCGNYIIGLKCGEKLFGKRVVVVDDVTTTGNTLKTVINVVRNAGGIVEKVITVVDREEGAYDLITHMEVPFSSLMTLSQILSKKC